MENKKNEILLHEHSIINNKIDSFINSQFKYITTLISMSAGFIYVTFNPSLKSTLSEYIVLLPYLIIIIGSIFLYKFNRAVILHGYRHYIEEEIKISDKKIIFGAALVKAKLLETNPFAKFNYFVMFLLFISTVFKCNYKISCELLYGLNFNFFIQFPVIIFSIIFFYKKNKIAFNEGYEFVKKNYTRNENQEEEL